MTRQSILWILVLGLTASQTGCFWFTSKGEGEALKNEVPHLKDRIAQMENEQAEKQAHLTDMIDRARGEVAKLELAVDGAASLRIYDLAGHRVKVLHDGFLEAGPHQLIWDGRDDRDRLVASGTYFVQLDSAGAHETRKMVLLR